MNDYERSLLNRSANEIEGLEKRASAAEGKASVLENQLNYIKAAMDFVQIGKQAPYSNWEALIKDASALSDTNFDIDVLEQALELHRNASPSMGKVANRKTYGAAADTPEGRFEAKLQTIIDGGH